MARKKLISSHGKSITQLFQEYVAKWKDAVALTAGDTFLTYGELNKLSDYVACLLVEKGISPGDITGIMLERSIEMVVGILGILKAGAAYLPIDPNYPQERIEYMLKDSNAKVLIINKSESPRRGHPIKNINDRIINDQNKNQHFWAGYVLNFENLNFEFVSNFVLRASNFNSSNLAYIMYTSGSTGKPKGVAVEEHSVVNVLTALSKAYPITPGAGYLLKTSFLFDVSVTELFGWFIGGGRLILLEKDGEKDPQLIIDTIVKNNVTHINFVPAMFSTFTGYLDEQNIAKIAGLKYIFLAGEALSPGLINRFRRLNKSIRLENLYGPTEGTVYASGYSLGEWDGTSSIPIGKALPGVTLHIINEQGSEVPTGETGELCIAGAGVARGYLNNPELTNNKFILPSATRGTFKKAPLDPPKLLFNNSPLTIHHSPIYKTGDLARQLPDGPPAGGGSGGVIEFLGRLDYQIKIRGFRIELGEIENRLLMHPEIQEAVVMAKDHGPGDKYLCAYIKAKLKMNAANLKEFLARHLPEYMIPSFFVFIEEFPLTGSGKVDRKLLPDPEIVSSARYIAPRDAVEEKLVKIWSDILNIDQQIIGINANFFELGGRSLKGAEIIQRIHKTFNVRLQLSQLFKMPTINDLATYIKAASEDRYMDLEKAPVKDYYRLSSSQMRLYVLYRLNPGSTAYNIPSAFSLTGAPDPEQIQDAFRKLISRHESLRTSYRMIGGKPVQVIHETVEFELEILTGTEQEFIRPFDLSQAPLLRAALSKDNDLLMIDIHHIAADGLSLDILMEELPQAFAGQELPPLPFQYKDYSERQSREREEETSTFKNQRNYWLNEFSQNSEIPVLSLPLDYTRPAVQSFAGNTIYVQLTETERTALLKLVNTANTTLYILMLSAFNILLAKLSGQEDIVIGTPLAGRTYVELRRVIGMFVKTLALRNFPAGKKNFNEFLNEVKDRTLTAFENQDYPFEDLVEAVVLQREVNRNPLFDCMFGLESIENIEFAVPGLHIKPRPTPSRIAKFDLTLTVEERTENLTLRLEYCTALFNRETVTRFLGYYREILHSILLDPAKQLSEIMIISEAEQKKILTEFNNTDCDYPRDKTIREFFIEQTEKSPDYIALHGCMIAGMDGCMIARMDDCMDAGMDDCMDAGMDGEVETLRATSLQNQNQNQNQYQITYHELNEQTNHAAALLIEKGVSPGMIIPIMIERSLEMMAGLLAILKTGSAYLPVEPDEPAERKLYMLADSAAKMIVTTRPLIEKDENISKWPGTKFFIEECLNGRGGPAGDKVPQAACPGPAYLIYTSGSTGIPKGVIVGQASTVNLLLALYRAYPIYPTGAYLLKTAFIFDVSVSELFGWFMGGSRLVVMEKRGEGDPQKIFDAIAKHRVTHINFAPAMFNVFISKLDLRSIKQISGLTYIFLAGEALPPELVQRFRQFNTPIRLENLYGPTEGTVYVSGYSLSHWNDGPDIPIGKPLSNVRLYILDAEGRHKAIGETGELIIAGEGLAWGYLNNPELTAEKFRPLIKLMPQISLMKNKNNALRADLNVFGEEKIFQHSVFILNGR
ncbi:MAG: amino acid adenylation domain-containing protein, partial [Acidobacteria bacterium]|nr:amino acid adenylation domain-containing protein [Acidobacteriota bacterium]